MQAIKMDMHKVFLMLEKVEATCRATIPRATDSTPLITMAALQVSLLSS